jgi:hypothetical protein
MAGKVTTNTTVAKLPLSKLTFGDCTKPTNVLKNGELEIASGGVVTARGNEVTVFDLGVSCIYGGGSGTRLGTLDGGTPAVFTLNTIELPKLMGGFLCENKGKWIAEYTVTTPATTVVD